MRDLKIEELGHVYGAGGDGGGGKDCSPGRPDHGSKGPGSKGHDYGSKGHGSKGYGSKGHGSKGCP